MNANRKTIEEIHRNRLSNGGARKATTAILGMAAFLFLTAGAARPAQAQTFTLLHSFSSSNGDAANPITTLARDSAGNLYGTTRYGGASGEGAVFRIDPSGNETVLYSFTGGNDGASPYGGLILDSSGNLDGTALFGGTWGAGVVFELNPSTGLETVLYSFTGGNDGEFPFAGLVRDANGNLYGTTFLGGAFGEGVVFKLDASANETTLHSFSGADGALPYASLVLGADGDLYGTTNSGGAAGHGTVFKIDPTSGNETLLYSFSGGADGANPYAGVIFDANGNLYGTTFAGGTYNDGTVFKIDPSGAETVLHSFSSGSDGANPYAGLVLDSAGDLYGTTLSGGPSLYGIVFEIDSSGNEKVLHSFSGLTDGMNAYAGLTLDQSGNLYGATYTEGPSGGGTAFEIAQTYPFAAFTASLNITSGFQLEGDFTQAPGAPAIDPMTQGLTITVGTYTVTVPATAFQETTAGSYLFTGVINGVTLQVHLTQTGTNSYQIHVHASGVDPSSVSGPTTITVTAGKNTGTTQVSTF